MAKARDSEAPVPISFQARSIGQPAERRCPFCSQAARRKVIRMVSKKGKPPSVCPVAQDESGFDRPNIRLQVLAFSDEPSKRKALLIKTRRAERPGIVYVATRKHAEEIGGELAERGDDVVVYHDGMQAAERAEAQEAFMSGQASIIVATNAFGMGIDKPDVRFVYHYDVADSLDSYYQEIGRAGRDGLPAEAILFYRRADLHLHRRMETSRIEMMQVYAEIDHCRRQFLLNYFGEPYKGPCHNCDNDERNSSTVIVAATDEVSDDPLKPFPLKSWVVHSQWGKGLVARYDRNKIVILFDEVGYKTFLLPMVLDKGLLKPLSAGEA